MNAAADFAIVVGIARYPYLKDLQGPVQDATQFQQWLLGVAGVPADHVKFIVSEGPPRPGNCPVQDEIDDAFVDVFRAASELPRARRLYFYFAGHGCAQAMRHTALLVANASLDTLDRSLNTESYHEGLARRMFPEQVFFYDCCRNWDQRASGRGPGWTHIAPSAHIANVRQFVFYAAGFTEFASEAPLFGEPHGTRRGLFTVALLEGLNGKAVKRDLGRWIVSTGVLTSYVENRLKDLTQNLGISQHPTWNPAGLVGDLELIQIGNPELFPLIVITDFPSGVNVLVKDGQLNEYERKPLTGNQVCFDLPLGLYQICIEPGGPQLPIRVGPGESSVIRLQSR